MWIEGSGGSSPLLPNLIYRKDQIDFFHVNVPISLDVEHVLSLSHDITIVTLAQAYTETALPRPDGSWGPGLSRAYTEACNPFGMRWFEELHGKDAVGGGDPLPPIELPTMEFLLGKRVKMLGKFRHFPNLTEAYMAHGWLMQTARYLPARTALARATVEKPGWKNFALALGPKASPQDSEHCGYSTTPSYGASLISEIITFRLFDPRMLLWFATGADPGQAAVGSGQSADGSF